MVTAPVSITIYILLQKNKIDLSSVEGSPYVNKTFKFGSAVDKLTNTSQNFYLRYNAYNDEIQMKSSLDEKNIYGLVKATNIYAVIDAKEYHYLSFMHELRSSLGKMGQILSRKKRQKQLLNIEASKYTF